MTAMSTSTPVLAAPVAWQPGLVGDYPGQQSFVELGSARVPMVFCWCPPTPPGWPFLMGSPPDEPERRDNEQQRQVEIPEGFWLARHPVNQRQWQAVMGTNPSQRGQGELHPVNSVSWNDAQEFCRKATLRLPSEVEWEYACRAGTTTPFGIGGGQCLNAQLANFAGNYPYGSGREAFKWTFRERTTPEGSFPPNAWGLHDMHGNVSEWVLDQYVPNFYASEAGKLTENPLAVPKTLYPRAVRGGSWDDDAALLRSSARRGSSKDWMMQDPQIPQSIWYMTDADFVGFRVVRPLTKPDAEKAKLYEPEYDAIKAYKEASAGKQ